MHLFHQLLDLVNRCCHGNSLLSEIVPRYGDDLSALEVTGSNLNSDGDTLAISKNYINLSANQVTYSLLYLQLPVVVLPSRGVVITEIATATNPCLLQLLDELVTLAKQVFLVLR